ncbi:hypothetical protein N7539_001362 [Penicillium diatomitis]|uniref:LPXTG-motif cell wall anchor domain protein n=1 Tax=Penicillium diatomitis TaxID=2819901 RepID=A0A9W9XGM9_9EURO|nr:uncharacterized protein N7539_001362 [Penicillium diatomitis]KAJ5492616.1 hypothetical protein N7539_001362 [Penicillium diatomitis]
MPSSRVQSETKTFASDHDRGLNGVSRLGSDTNNRRNSAIFNNTHNNHNGTKGHPSSTLGHSPNMDDGRVKNEDVFLNIARSDSSRRDSLGRADFRRVSGFLSIATAGHASENKAEFLQLQDNLVPRFSHSVADIRGATHAEPEQQTPSLDQRFSNPESPVLAQKGSPTILGGTHNYAISASTSVHPLDDPTRFRYPNLNSGSRSVIGAPRSHLSRASPETSPRSPPTRGERRSSIHEPRPRRSTLSTSRNGRLPSSSDPIERGPETTEKARDGTESTLSTNAPSTVWDELDDLKSRIRKLELTGKLPPSSQEAISGASQERPRTAATTVTVLSSSPRQQRKARSPSAEKAVQNPVHPLLQTAMTKSQEVLAPEVYSALEATIKDALALSTMLGVNAAPSGTVSVVNGGFASPERLARRKADSVCRSLTELCLALTDKQLRRDRSASTSRVLESHSLRANSGETESLAGSSAYQRITAAEAGALERQPSTSSRITSRLEARRLSLINTGVPTTGDSRVAQSPSVAPPPSRLHRLSASIRSRRLAQDDELDTTSPLSRSLSRAVTEAETSSLGQSTSTQPRLSLGRSINRSMPNAMQQGQREQVVDLSPRTLQYQHQGSASVSSPQSQPQTPTPSSNIPYRRSYIATPAQSPAIPRSNIQGGSRRYGLSSDLPDSTAGSVVEGRTRFNAADVPRNRTSIPPAKSAVTYTPVSQPRLRTNSLDTRRFGLRRRSAATPDESLNLDDSID